jgi:hypothetical protein
MSRGSADGVLQEPQAFGLRVALGQGRAGDVRADHEAWHAEDSRHLLDAEAAGFDELTVLVRDTDALPLQPFLEHERAVTTPPGGLGRSIAR